MKQKQTTNTKLKALRIKFLAWPELWIICSSSKKVAARALVNVITKSWFDNQIFCKNFLKSKNIFKNTKTFVSVKILLQSLTVSWVKLLRCIYILYAVQEKNFMTCLDRVKQLLKWKECLNWLTVIKDARSLETTLESQLIPPKVCLVQKLGWSAIWSNLLVNNILCQMFSIFFPQP